VQVNQTARLEASGGNGTFSWSFAQGGRHEEGGNDSIGISYTSSGRKTVRVSSAGMSATCTVDVVSASPTPSESTGPGPTPTPSTSPGPSKIFSVRKSGRNTTTGEPSNSGAISVYPGQTAQFTVSVTNISPFAFNNVRLTDTLPPGMSYKNGSTRVENQPVASDVITTTGLPVGGLTPGQEVTVQWSAVANRTGGISAGPNRTTPQVRVSANSMPDILADMSVTVYGGGTSGISNIPTGPGGAVMLSLLTAALLTLLYSGYTRSDAFRRREAEIVGRDQGPLDFRS
jgi:uncharacterized repeat protein (TIGR01451 family)